MEKVVWKGTFAETEERDKQYWKLQAEEFRLQTLLELQKMVFPDESPRIEKVSFKKSGVKKNDNKGQVLFEDFKGFSEICNPYQLKYRLQ